MFGLPEWQLAARHARSFRTCTGLRPWGAGWNISFFVRPRSLAVLMDQSMGLTRAPWLLAPKLNFTPSSLAILRNGIVGRRTLESISMAVLVFLQAITT